MSRTVFALVSNPPPDGALIHWVLIVGQERGIALCEKATGVPISLTSWGVGLNDEPDVQAKLNCQECLELKHA